MVEEWKDIPGYEGWYQVSNYGTVQSLLRSVEFTSCKGTKYERVQKGQILAPGVNGSGYAFVNLSKNNITQMFRIHRLVAQLFLLNQNCCREVNHIDGDKLNNHVTNLEWVTSEENRIHSVRVLKKGNIKLTHKQVVEIKKQLITGEFSHKQLSEKYRVKKTTITQISTGRNWKHVTLEETP